MAAEGAVGLAAVHHVHALGGIMKLRRWLFGLLILTQVASSGCMLFHRDRCACGERRGLFGFLTKHRGEGGVMMSGGMECGAPCTTCGGGDFPGMAGPMFAGPGLPPDERLGAPAANRPWEGPGAPPAQLPKSNPASR